MIEKAKKITFALPAVLCAAVLISSAASAVELPAIYWQLANEDRYVYRSDMEKLDWREIRERRKLNKTANQEIKTAELKAFGEVNHTGESYQPGEILKGPAVLFMHDPQDGKARPTRISDTEVAVRIPEDTNLNGRYLLGAAFRLENFDVDGDGTVESVYLSAKQFIRQYKNGGITGKGSVVFFDDPVNMPLEIGPVINTAENRFGGGTQWPHREYEMMVKYLGKPLAGAKVTAHAMSSHWEKQFTTNQDGIFVITPTDDRTDPGHEWQTYLFIASHHDAKNTSCHITTFPVIVYKNRPEWYTKTMGFTFWSITGTAMVTLIVMGLAQRTKRRETHKLTVFDKYGVKEDI